MTVIGVDKDLDHLLCTLLQVERAHYERLVSLAHWRNAAWAPEVLAKRREFASLHAQESRRAQNLHTWHATVNKLGGAVVLPTHTAATDADAAADAAAANEDLHQECVPRRVYHTAWLKGLVLRSVHAPSASTGLKWCMRQCRGSGH